MKLRLFLSGILGSGAILVAARGDEIAPTAILFWLLAILSMTAGYSAFEQYEKDRQ